MTGLTKPRKIGGKDELHVIGWGGSTLHHGICGSDDTPCECRGLKELIHARQPHVRTLELSLALVEGMNEMTALAARQAESGREVDIVILSFEGELEGRHHVDIACFKTKLLRLVQSLKSDLAAHVLVLNASSYDPDDRRHRYTLGTPASRSLRAQSVNLALLDLSYEEGISIIDVDRLLAELGALQHVQAPFCYSCEAFDTIREEILWILEDIGFFQARPLLEQMGKRAG